LPAFAAGLGLAALAFVAAVLAMTPRLDRHRRRALRRILRDTCEVLNRREVRYWCDYGTLLGLVRDGDLILGDKDADLCILADQKPAVMAAAAELAALGYRLTDKGGARRRLIRVLDTRTPFYVDVYPYARDGELLRSLLDPIEDLPAPLVAETRSLAALGTRITAPADADALLRYRYGPRYATPRRNDKGRAAAYSRWKSYGEDLEAGACFAWHLLKRPFSKAEA
jgi:hypothetical protein